MMTFEWMSFFPGRAARLARLGRPLGKALGKLFSFSLADDAIAPAQCLSVHLACGGISVVHGARVFSRLTIKGTRHYPFEAEEYPSPETVASAVRLAIDDLKAAQADVTLIVPKAWAIVKKAAFPPVVRQNLANVVRFELDRLTPLNPERAYYDYRIIGEEGDRLQILLAAMKAERLDPYLSALAQKGIAVKRVIVSLSALGVLSHHAHGGEATAFLEIRPSGYDGGFMVEKGLQETFSGSFASASEAEKAAIVAQAVNPGIEALRKAGKGVAVMIDSQADLAPSLSQAIHAPVRYLGGADLKLPPFQPGTVPLHTALGGLLESLETGSQGPNLLALGVHRSERTPLALTAILLICLVALGLFAIAASLQIETRKAEALDREIAARVSDVKQVETLQKESAALVKEIHAIDRFKAGRPKALDLFREVTLILPQNAWLARVHVTDSTVGIEGYAASATDILSKLEGSPYFRKVEFASPTVRDGRMNADRFAIRMDIEGAGEEKNAKK